MPTAASPPPSSRGPSTGAVERLHVLWLAGSLLLLLLVVVVTLLGSGQLRRHAQRISEQSRAIDQLRADLSRTRDELANLKAATPDTAPALRAPPDPVAERRQAARPTEDRLPEPELEPAGPTGAADDDAIAGLLQAALRRSESGAGVAPALAYELVDRAAAEEALREGLQASGHRSWTGETWVRLAIVARLLERDGPAEMFALKAVAAKEFPGPYYELSARRSLARGQTTEAIVFARRLADGRPADPNGVLLLAEAHRAHGDLPSAGVAIEGLTDVERLSLPAKLRLGRLLVVLERWDRLGALVAPLGKVPEPALAQVNYLRAVLAIQRGQLPEALAILDNLLAESQVPARGFAVPDDYELRTWRGVALLAARQYEPAREAFAQVEEHTDRPEGWYWRGMLELRVGNTDQAVSFFQHALAASQRFAPAWEALGTIALNAGDLPTAVQNFENAAGVNPRRASAHFLLAIVHAKQSQPRETAEALRSAFRLDRSLRESAGQTEVIRRLFSEEELAALAGVDGVAPVAPNEVEPR